MKKILIFGKIPPPIGGVTKSILNLVGCLEQKKVLVTLFDFEFKKLTALFHRYDLVHINSSSLLKRAIAVIIGKLVASKVVFVVHGNRFETKSKLNILSVKIADGVIVLNQSVLNSVLSLNKPKESVFLQTSIFQSEKKNVASQVISTYIAKNKTIFLLYSNNSGSLDGREIYGLDFFFKKLIAVFNPKNDAFIIIDLDGGYSQAVLKLKTEYEVDYYDQPTDFTSLLGISDCYIRPTNFDGSSVAVLEAISQQVPVVASDVVERPSPTITYKVDSILDFERAISEFREKKDKIFENPESNITSFHDFLAFVESLDVKS